MADCEPTADISPAGQRDPEQVWDQQRPGNALLSAAAEPDRSAPAPSAGLAVRLGTRDPNSAGTQPETNSAFGEKS